MNWNILDSEEQLNNIIEESSSVPVLIFKHSTRCSISSMAKSRLERQWDLDENSVKPYVLDLIANRNVSSKIEEVFSVQHESPQALLIKKGACVYNDSHNGISVSEIGELLA